MNVQWLKFFVAVFGLLLLSVAAAHAQSCTPNNNSVFGISGSTLSTTSPQPAGTYTAGVIVNIPGTSNSGTCFPVTITGQTSGGGGPSVVQNQLVQLSGAGTSPGTCVWTIGQNIGAGNTLVGYIHAANGDGNGYTEDSIEEYPFSVTDNAGNTYTLSGGVHWLPWPEDIGYWYLTNIQGHPNTFTFHFSGYPAPPVCNAGFTEYSNAASVSVIGPALVYGTTPSISITPAAPSLIWAFAADFAGAPNPNIIDLTRSPNALHNSGYSVLIDNYQPAPGRAGNGGDDIGVWGSNALVSAAPLTLTWDAPNGSSCSFTTDGSGCPTMLIVAAVSSSSVPTASLSANPTSITAGGSSTLTWSSTNASSCTGAGFSTGNAVSGFTSVSPGSTTTYTVTCGTATASATVTVSGVIAGAFYVDPNGNDGNPGTAAQPWQTVAKAAQATQASGSAVTVVFNAGTYPVSSPLGLSGDKHGSTWMAAAGARPVLSGGTRITGWTLHDAGNNIWQASVPSGLDFREFYVNQKEALLARGLYGTTEWVPNSSGWTDPTGQVQNFTNKTHIEIISVSGWQYSACHVVSVSGTQITMEQPCWSHYVSNQEPNDNPTWCGNCPPKRWAQNAYELLTSSGPGSWYLNNSANTVYYIPRTGENMATADAEAPVLSQFLDAQLSNMTFSHLTFAYTSWLAPNQGGVGYQTGASGSWNCTTPNCLPHPPINFRPDSNGNKLQNNRFMGLSSPYAMRFEYGSSNNQILANEFVENAGSAIAIGQTDTFWDNDPTALADPPTNNTIKDNLIAAATTQSSYYDAPGIMADITIGSNITHNSESGFGWAGAHMTSAQTMNSNNQYTNNRVANYCIYMFDCGGFYSSALIPGSINSSVKATISGNYFISSAYHMGCMYNDYGSYLEVENANVCDITSTFGGRFVSIANFSDPQIVMGAINVTNNYTTALGICCDALGGTESNNTQISSGSYPSGAQAIINNAGVTSGVTPGPGGGSQPPPAISPDGSTISGGTGTLQSVDGTWTFGAQQSPGEWYTLLNGANTGGGYGSQMMVANGGKLYVKGIDGNWYLFANGAFTSTGPNPPYPPPSTASLSASPTSIASGGSSTLTWSSTNATSCAGAGFSTGNATSGSTSVSPSITTTYSVACGNATASATVTVSGVIAGAFYVDPNGNDGNPGTAAQPWQTVAHAVQVTQATGSAITIVFNAGTYPVSSPLGLSGDRRGSVWMAAPGTKPVLYGGTQITGWTLHDAANNIWQASVPSGLDFREFYINGQARQRARGLYGVYTFTGSGFIDPTGGVQNLSDITNVEIIDVNGWQYEACKISSVSGTTITMQEPCWDKYVNVTNFGNVNGNGPNYFNWAENAYELLTQQGAGAWYLKKSTNTVYYIPLSGENMTTAVGTAPVLTQFISGQLSNMTFSHLTFAYTSWLTPQSQGYWTVQAGLLCCGGGWPPAPFDLVAGSNGNVFDHNLFLGLSGNYAIHLDSSSNNQFTANQFYENAGGGINLGNDQNILIQNNDIAAGAHQSGYYDAPGMIAQASINTNVDHNHIANFWWGTAQWTNPQSYHTNNFFTNNFAQGNCAHLNDCGGVYSTSYDTNTPDTNFPKFTVTGNYFLNIGPQLCMYGDTGAWEGLYQNNVCDNPNGLYIYGGNGNVTGDPTENGLNSGFNTVTGNYSTTLATFWYYPSPGNNVSNNTQISSGSYPSGAQAIINNAGPRVNPGP